MAGVAVQECVPRPFTVIWNDKPKRVKDIPGGREVIWGITKAQAFSARFGKLYWIIEEMEIVDGIQLEEDSEPYDILAVAV
tara:strand:- start:5017 stop:5259 length:243 start_codon:yes stop_codon:yes gene_type:complete